MNQLNDYIFERIRIDNIRILKFPIDGTYDEVIIFLKEAGFGELPYKYRMGKYKIRNEVDTIHAFNTERSLLFYGWAIPEGCIIRFADTSTEKISVDNPMFEIWYDKNHKRYAFWITKEDSKMHTASYDEFKKLLNKQFGW
jgi:hypothetical protein